MFSAEVFRRGWKSLGKVGKFFPHGKCFSLKEPTDEKFFRRRIYLSSTRMGWFYHFIYMLFNDLLLLPNERGINEQISMFR